MPRKNRREPGRQQDSIDRLKRIEQQIRDEQSKRPKGKRQ